jgi:Arc/MetJ family transcription regulator
MKRTNLVLDEDLLKEATREMGLKTYSATVNAILKEFVREKNVEKLADFVGKVKWIGDLSEMREDRPRKRPTKRIAKRSSTRQKRLA